MYLLFLLLALKHLVKNMICMILSQLKYLRFGRESLKNVIGVATPQ